MLIRGNRFLEYEEVEKRIFCNLNRLSRIEEVTPLVVAVQEENITGCATRKENGMLRYRTKKRSLINKFGAWFKSLIKLYKTRDQAILCLKLAAETEDKIYKTESKISVIESRLQSLRASVEDVRALEGRIEALEGPIEALEGRINVIECRIETIEARTTDRNRRDIDNMHGHLSKINADMSRLRDEVMFQQRRLTKIALSEGDNNAGSKPAVKMNFVHDERFDAFYAAFEDVFRGERSDIKSRLIKYVDRLKLAGAGQLNKPVLDLGCGRGEWLELLKEHHIPAYGVDSNGMMAERAQALGLDARRGDALEHLSGLPDSSLSAVTAFHVVEHIPFDALISWLDEAMRVIVPGGLILLETPNPETIRVGATTFYNDPTHRNPLPPTVLKFMVEHRGFEMAEILRLHPFTDGLLQEPTADAELLNRVLFGPQDYAVIARRL